MPFNEYIALAESRLNLLTLTEQYGLQSFRYESSCFLPYLKSKLTLGGTDTFYDLGSGYGEVLFALAEQFRTAAFCGVEIVKERVALSKLYARKTGLANVKFRYGDVLTADLTGGNYFYLFNPFFDFQYPVLLAQLEAVAQSHPIHIIAEAKACDYFDSAGWLRKTDHVTMDHLRKLCRYISV